MAAIETRPLIRDGINFTSTHSVDSHSTKMQQTDAE